jgi:hypothetical protein
MLANEHLLLHSSWDWGGGDFESGIEAAGHVGNKEIAAFLLANGARYNIYLACMLGHLDIVKQALTFNPGLLNSKGPHGFTMLHHAQRGGEESKSVADYLQSLGAKETKIDFYARHIHVIVEVKSFEILLQSNISGSFLFFKCCRAQIG